MIRAFGTLHPLTAFFYFCAVLSVAMFSTHPILLAQALLGGLCFCASLERPREFLRSLGFALPLFLLTSVTNPLFAHNGVTPLFFMNGNPVTREALLCGAALATMLLAVLQWSRAYGYIMTTDKFLYLFGRAVPRLALTLSMAMRFVPLFRAQTFRVHRAQKAMGLYTGKSLSDRFRAASRVFLAMISWSLENAADTGDVMHARGCGLKGRSHFSLFRWSVRDAVLLAFSAALLGIVLLGQALGGATFYFYPRISALSGSPLSMAVYIAFGALTLLPCIMEMKENMKWIYSVSKI